MKIALVCPSVGLTQRGYERFVTDLFRTIAPSNDVTLFKGAGFEDDRERVIPHLRRTGWLRDACFGRLRYARHHLEFASFALALSPSLLKGRFDVLHFIDPALAPLLHAIRRSLGLKSRLLFSDAGAIPSETSRWVDHIHCLTPSRYTELRRAGVHSDRITMIPVGLDPKRFETARTREEIRIEANLNDSAFVVLDVASVNRHHKRIDYLINEVSLLGSDSHLWLDGSLHPDGDPSLLAAAESRLGSRFRYTHLPSSRIGELYRGADIFVSTATQESFGMALVEAAASGLPVVAHDSDHFRWLLGEQGNFANLNQPGALAALLKNFNRTAKYGLPAVPFRRYNWQNLVINYTNLYARAAAVKSRTNAV